MPFNTKQEKQAQYVKVIADSMAIHRRLEKLDIRRMNAMLNASNVLVYSSALIETSNKLNIEIDQLLA